MILRLVSGIIGAVFVISILLFNNRPSLLVNALLSLIAVLSMVELFNAMEISKMILITIPTMVFVTIMPTLGGGNFWQLCWYFYTIVMLTSPIIDKKISLRHISLVYMMAIIITISLGKLVETRNLNGEFGSFYVILALATAWTSDTGAYFFGKFIGKNKLCPQVSPRKTIEGVIGGIFVCVLSLIFIGFLFENLVFCNQYKVNYSYLILMGVIGSLVSALGDLSFSLIKRKCHIKDFGNAIPGHGGVLDRFDSVIFVAPYAYFFIKLFSIIIYKECLFL